ncbi:MAG TPA: YtxH domain-containing protein [Ktedonobacterales bacterium]|jgi:YtxH-like protein|nr:YtxH domain-containing protein [Ktedonobacterales bacterium]
MADETGQTKDTASVSPLSTNTPAWRPDDTTTTPGMSSGNGAAPTTSSTYDETAYEGHEASSPLPLVIGLAAAGLATAGAVAFFVGRRAQNGASSSTSLLSSDTLRNLTNSASDQLDDLRYTLKQQLVDRPYRATRPMRRQFRRSTAPLRRGADSLARTTRDVQRNARDVQREAQHRWERTMTGGRWWRRGMIWGGALGIVIGFLLAPKPGRELRDDISRRFEQIRPQAEKLYQQGKEQVDRFMQSRQS